MKSSSWHTVYQSINQETLRMILLWILLLTITCFPLGRFFQTVGPVVGGIGLFIYYLAYWRNSTLRHLPIAWVFIPFFVGIVLQIVLSKWINVSWESVSPNLYRGYLLLFIALEAVRKERDFAYLAVAFAISCLYMGLDGMWQWHTGFSFIKGESIQGIEVGLPRLTGSFGGFFVGDYMALTLLPSFALWYVLPVRKLWGRALLLALLLSPGFFLWGGAQARAGYLALVGGLYVLMAFILFRPRVISIALPVLAGIGVLFFGPSRVSLETAMQDGRFAIWQKAWNVFLDSPWIGFGGDAFTQALQFLGYPHMEGSVEIAHPHNIYLQWLAEGGVITFTLFMLFFGIICLWSFFRIIKGVQQEQLGIVTGQAWRCTAFFWSGFLGYLIIGLVGHDFYDTRFVPSCMILIGITLAGCVHNTALQRS